MEFWFFPQNPSLINQLCVAYSLGRRRSLLVLRKSKFRLLSASILRVAGHEEASKSELDTGLELANSIIQAIPALDVTTSAPVAVAATVPFQRWMSPHQRPLPLQQLCSERVCELVLISDWQKIN
ncbi:hypothetical protein PIB30_018296 [Stylosanthes scabra]|uniref:Uncharacterized protein n=1 Tax=Stylosanthes scabra TaxID=79078 RepID=A0ABU6Y8E1_9FABA|nr:hypothetical protein [Stylosanthes scabra]